MRKIKTFMAVAMAMLMASCSQTDDNLIPEPTPGPVPTSKGIKLSIVPQSSRATLKPDVDYGFKAAWEEGDEVYAFNITDIEIRNRDSYPMLIFSEETEFGKKFIVTATEAGKYTTFSGVFNEFKNPYDESGKTLNKIEEGDQIRLFYPTTSINVKSQNKIPEPFSVTEDELSLYDEGKFKLGLNISRQDGSLEGIAKKYDFRVGLATVTQVNTDVALATYDPEMTNLMSIQTLLFTDAQGNAIQNIKEVEVLNIPTYGVCDFTKIENLGYGKPESGKTVTITLRKFEDNKAYLAVFPGEAKPTYILSTHNGKVYSFTSATQTFKAGKSKALTIKMREVKALDHILVDGVQWAKGDLYYDGTTTGNNFITGWSVKDQSVISANNFAETQTPFFPYGIVGKDAFYRYGASLAAFTPAKNTTNLDEKFYSDPTFNTNTTTLPTDMQTTAYGDVVRWATNGQYRMPTVAEFNKLKENCIVQYGYIETLVETEQDSVPTQIQVYGVLFYPSSKNKGIRPLVKRFNALDLAGGLFFAAGFAEEYKDTQTLNAAPTKLSVHYWTADTQDAQNAKSFQLKYDLNSQDITEKDFIVPNPKSSYFLRIRPVKVSQ